MTESNDIADAFAAAGVDALDAPDWPGSGLDAPQASAKPEDDGMPGPERKSPPRAFGELTITRGRFSHQLTEDSSPDAFGIPKPIVDAMAALVGGIDRLGGRQFADMAELLVDHSDQTVMLAIQEAARRGERLGMVRTLAKMMTGSRGFAAGKEIEAKADAAKPRGNSRDAMRRLKDKQ